MLRTSWTRCCVGLLSLFLVVGCDSSTDPEVIDISGPWIVTADEVCFGSVVIDQDGTSFDVTGSMGGPGCLLQASGEGEGTISGNDISFGVAVGQGTGGGGTGTGFLQFAGTIAPGGDEISGTWSAGGLSGQWTAVRGVPN